MIRKFLQSFLRCLSRAILKRHKPEIIAITGSVGKTSAREACFCVLSQKFNVRQSSKNYNTEIGVPLTIIHAEPPGKAYYKWIFIIFKACFLIVFKSRKYPKILILELAADMPGDIEYFMSFIKPKISVLTTVSKVHLSKFKKFSHIVAEKRKIIETLMPENYAVLNFDDKVIQEMSKKTKARIMKFGITSSKLDVTATGMDIIVNKERLGLRFKLLYNNTVTPVFVKDVAVTHQVYNMLSASACGIIYDLTPLEIAQGLEKIKPTKGRFYIKKNKDDIWFIDDTYNASTVSMCSALKAVNTIPIGKRKVAVLADMLELGFYTREAHIKVGKKVASCKNIKLLLTYGKHAQIILKTAIKHGFKKSNAHHFNTHSELVTFLKANLKLEDVVLVKGSFSMRMDKVLQSFV